MSKSNVHPDHYKVGGRDRQDDAAAARMAQAKAIAAKPTSQQRPDRMGREPWFQRPEATKPAVGAASARPGKPARKESRSTTTGKPVARKRSAGRRAAATRKSSPGTRRPTKRATTRKKKGRPT